MGYGASKEKLGDRGSVEKQKDVKSGVSGNNQSSPQTSWQGKTKGDTTHKKQR